MEEDIAARLKKLIDNLKINSSQFADNCGISRPTLSLVLSGKNKKISDQFIRQVHNAYPQVSVLWLLFGDEPMMVDSKEQTEESDIKNKEGGSDSMFPELDFDLSSDNFSLQGTESSSTPSVSYTSNNGESPTLPQRGDIDSILKAVKSNPLIVERIINQEFASLSKKLESTLEIMMQRQKERKIQQITIYYDDSSFDTFFPKRTSDKMI